VKALLSHGANIDARDCDASTPLMVAARRQDEAIPTVRALLAAGADVHATDREGITALMIAAFDDFERSDELVSVLRDAEQKRMPNALTPQSSPNSGGSR
jgi:ankyrin repeat protein